MQDFVESSTDRRRTINLDNGNKFHIDCVDPYGFWFIHFDKGQLPDNLKGAYTSVDLATKAIESYVANKKPEKQEEASDAAPARSDRRK